MFASHSLAEHIFRGAAGIAALVVMSHYEHRHVTVAADAIHRGGIAAAMQIILRKAGMDLHLVFHSVWIWVLVVCCWCLRRMVTRLPGFVERFRLEIVAGTTATAACLALNDAGVPAAALCSLILWSALSVSADRGGLPDRHEDRFDTVDHAVGSLEIALDVEHSRGPA